MRTVGHWREWDAAGYYDQCFTRETTLAAGLIFERRLLVTSDFQQVLWDSAIEDDCLQIVRLAVREDLEREYDWTTVALVPSTATSRAHIVSRKNGVVAGLPAARLALAEMDPGVTWTPHLEDGATIVPGQRVATIDGLARSLLTAERLLLNLVGHLSGVATLTRQYVEAVRGTHAGIYDTRKTTPGWRRLEKYAVRCGGGHNHRTGLFDAILIKDNHLAFGAEGTGQSHFTPSEAVVRARQFLSTLDRGGSHASMLVEVEVDTLEQFQQVISAAPDIVLLDNMSLDQLRQAVAIRNQTVPALQLEASGGVNLQTVAGIAATGVDRISVGALTHSAAWFDVGLDWE